VFMLIKVSVAAVVFPPHTLAMLVAPPQAAYRPYSLGPTWKSVAYTALFGATLTVSRYVLYHA